MESTNIAMRRRSARLSQTRAQASSPELMPQPPPASVGGRKRKASKPPPTESVGPAASFANTAPSTPTKTRTRSKAGVHQPLTPTPSGAQIFAESADHGGRERPRHDVVARLADPESTNAPLLSPDTSRLVASRDAESVSPSKPKAPTAKHGTTTKNLLQEANEHLIRVDDRMRSLVERNHCRVFSPEGLAETIDPFESLTSGIISQQVSGAAAKSIKAKFIASFFKDPTQEQRFPHPSEVAICPMEQLRSAGLSQRKAEYIQGLACKFTSGELTAQMLHEAPYEEVLQKLLAVRGLGQWSVEMFACFGLKRMDVISFGDLGVQRGMAAWVGRDVAKLKSKGGKWKYMSEREMMEISDKFAPYRSLFMWYMWRVEETDVSTME